MLPPEVLQHIFSVSRWRWGAPTLSLDDRLRAMAVCSAWRDVLHPGKWPLGRLELDGLDEDDERLVPWVVSKRPAVKALYFQKFETPELLMVLGSVPRMVLGRLSIEAAPQVLVDCLPAIYQFSRLRRLDLDCEDDTTEAVHDVSLNFKALAPLTALEELGVSGWGSIHWEGGPLLPRITQLQLGCADVTLNTALPSLQRLRLYCASTVVLGGPHFHAPRLSLLCLDRVYRNLSVSWSQLGSLKELEARSMGAVVESGAAQLSALTNLTALSLAWSERQGGWDAGHVLLQAAPRSLRSLSLRPLAPDQEQAPALTRFSQLTSLQCGSLAIIPQLAPLKQLQELQFTSHSAASISVPELAMLSELASLRRLRFSRLRVEAEVAARCLKVLLGALPRGCRVTECRAVVEEAPAW